MEFVFHNCNICFHNFNIFGILRHYIADTDKLFLNAEKHGISMSRSRPLQEERNCFVEQKNSTHVRQAVGYLRYNTTEEQAIMNDLYRNEFRLYKNFFQPVMKLASKERINGKIHKKQGQAMTPFKRLMASPAVPEAMKAQLRKLYTSLNPAELKRNIDAKLSQLYRAHQKKNGLPVEASPNMRKSSVAYSVKIYHSTDAVSVS